MGEYVDKTKGKVKQAVGVLTDDKKLVREGERDERKGQVKGAIKDLKKAAKGVARDAKQAARDAVK